ncbi:hypothetical protein [Lutispora thermophila]|uniref:Uncharacterized protein n=1 Tax=Lutispora thermophila DSM 19022 TaxID=1122184 RepID=A0A1M6BA06_9FIRM|nr:hypothetical protein [Lutispora thermophila]SHI45418.1 hypothetical protein SAMN02745176_00346 [Lutispora thermophila DSM 19022]
MNKGLLKKIFYVLSYAVIIFASFYAKRYASAYNDLKSIMYYDFDHFGKELENLNDNICQLLLLDHTFNENNEFINKNILRNLTRSNLYTSDYGDGKTIYDFYEFYFQLDDNIKSIISDSSIDVSEQRYLEILYDYNTELIKEHKSIMGDLNDNWNIKKYKQIKRDIIKIYSSYCQKADDLLNNDKYIMLKSYKGSFKDDDLEEAKFYCEQIFSKLVEPKPLEYDNNSGQYIDVYRFYTNTETSYEKKPGIRDNEVKYEILYEKNTGKITVQAIEFWVPSNIYSENELDNRADTIVSRFNDRVFLYDKQSKYDDEGKLDSIAYSYIRKIDDIYDEMEKITLVIESHGIISKFEIIHHENKEITMPSINKEDIINKLNDKCQVKEIILIRNIAGQLEYEAHVEYKGTLYSIVFDGDNGHLKHFGREMRNYNIN